MPSNLFFFSILPLKSFHIFIILKSSKCKNSMLELNILPTLLPSSYLLYLHDEMSFQNLKPNTTKIKADFPDFFIF